MNVKLFFKILIILLVAAAISYEWCIENQDKEETLLYFIVSLPTFIFMLPYLIWVTTMNVSLAEEGYFYAAAFFDIVLYAFIIERLMSLYAQWRAGKKM